MKEHKNSILLCQMNDGTVNCYINGIPFIVDNRELIAPSKIANNPISRLDILEILNNLVYQIKNLP